MTDLSDEAPPAREPVFTAPGAALLLFGAILGAYAAQIAFAPGDAAALKAGFSLAAVGDGRWWTVISSIFVHGGWTHALVNAVGALAFGSPVARYLGDGRRGVAVFFAFFLATAVVATLGFALLHWRDPAVLIGASGGVSGLMGAASRLYAGGGRRLDSLFGRIPLGFLAAIVVANVIVGLTGLSPGMEGAVIAWEAHIAGFLAGMLLIGSFGRLAGVRPRPRLPWDG